MNSVLVLRNRLKVLAEECNRLEEWTPVIDNINTYGDLYGFILDFLYKPEEVEEMYIKADNVNSEDFFDYKDSPQLLVVVKTNKEFIDEELKEMKEDQLVLRINGINEDYEDLDDEPTIMISLRVYEDSFLKEDDIFEGITLTQMEKIK